MKAALIDRYGSNDLEDSTGDLGTWRNTLNAQPLVASLVPQHGSRIETHREACGEETGGEPHHRECARDRQQRHRIPRGCPDQYTPQQLADADRSDHADGQSESKL